MFDSWLTLSGSGMDLRTVDRDLTPHMPSHSGGSWGRPAKFATHRDVRDRFEFGCPLNWQLELGESTIVRSKRLASFARIDVLSGPESSWQALREVLAPSAGSLTILKESPGTPRRLRGLLERDGRRFDVQSRAWTRGTETIVLTTASETGSGPFKLYEDQVLAAIRRGFRLL